MPASPTSSTFRQDKIQQFVNSRHFSATTDFSKLKEIDAVLICVPTPLDERREPDLSYVEQTAISIQPHLQKGQLVVLESTTYPGTTEELVLPILEKSGLRCPIASGLESENIPTRFFPGLFARTRRSRQQAVRPGANSQSGRRHQSAQQPRGAGPVRASRRESCSGQLHARRGNGQAPRKYFPLRQHRAGQRTEAAGLAHEHRHLGSDRRRRHQAFRLHAVLSRPRPRRPLHSRRSLLSFLEGARIRFRRSLHRTGRRNQHCHALPRGGCHRRLRSTATRKASTARSF